jgi:hypothetical protein
VNDSASGSVGSVRVTPGAWTIREIVEHLSGNYYADAVGDLAAART